MLIATESLTRMDKLRLIEQFWEELLLSPDEIASPAWHADAPADAERVVANGEVAFMDWEQAKERLRQIRA